MGDSNTHYFSQNIKSYEIKFDVKLSGIFPSLQLPLDYTYFCMMLAVTIEDADSLLPAW
jgi:hypothetical protein